MSRHPLVLEFKHARDMIAGCNFHYPAGEERRALAKLDELIERVDRLADLTSEIMEDRAKELLADIQRPTMRERMRAYLLRKMGKTNDGRTDGAGQSKAD